MIAGNTLSWLQLNWANETSPLPFPSFYLEPFGWSFIANVEAEDT